MESFQFKSKIIEYTLERKKIKNCYISVQNAVVNVRVPKKISQERIEEILLKKADWILKSLEKQKEKRPKEYVNGEVFKVLGKDAVLRISYEKIEEPKIKFCLNQLNVTLPIEDKGDSKEKVKKIMDYFYKELAQKEVAKAMNKITKKVGIAPKNYKIKNLKSTWGNCSTTENISINKNVVYYSRHAIEYVCLHEICHLQHMDHSCDFWNMVENYMPDYKEAEKELKS